ncbi:MAG: HNH endonuclease [Desulfovibrionales bacterium]|nr:MAG: HNH endonuclease [Desulfovibrionales bacterium]
MSILDLAAQGDIAQPFVEPSFDLSERFASYWSLIMPSEATANMAYPFYFMKSENFWTLVPKPGMESTLQQRQVTSMARLRGVILGAKISEELFHCINDKQCREQVRAALLHTYFSPDARPILLRDASENQEAFEYSQRLLAAAEKAMPYAATEERPRQVRDQGFRKAVMSLYKHRCALCGIRMLTPDGHTIVEAAHIRPWSESKDDRPVNGMALCRLCHWSFDEGFMSVGKEYEVLVSPMARAEQNNPGVIMTLECRPIFRPEDARFIPDQECLGWHRREVFKT